MSAIFFQPKGIKPEYVEVGVIVEDDINYIHYINEPCKVLKNDVKIIPEENVFFDKKEKLYKLIKL